MEIKTSKKIQKTPIQEFYTNSKIFITGGTGFLGIILIEKLLRSCSDLDTLFVLVRNKKGKTAEERLDDLFSGIIFENLIKENPKFREKVVPIIGDCAEPNLGISENDKQKLINEVTLIFHCAATVNFEEKLQVATCINIRGTRDLIALSRQMKNLKFITHVSTAYVHCYLNGIAEKFYKAPIGFKEIITLAENMPSDLIDNITPTLIKNFPNTYTFTKTVTEDLLKECTDLPLGIFRPAIVVSTYKTPIPGWINNLYGPQGVTTAAMLGLLHVLRCDLDVNANVVPVDMCVNTVIAIPWEGRGLYEKSKANYEIPIYNFESNTYRPINWRSFQIETEKNGKLCPSIKMVGIYKLNLVLSPFWYNIEIALMHYLPALFVDVILQIMGKKPMLFNAYKKIHKFSSVITYFATQQWNFTSKNVALLSDRMTSEDKELFPCDMRTLDWVEFFTTYIRGCRRYLLKDKDETIPIGFKRYFRLQVATFFALLLFFLLLGWILYSLFMFTMRLFE